MFKPCPLHFDFESAAIVCRHDDQLLLKLLTNLSSWTAAWGRATKLHPGAGQVLRPEGLVYFGFQERSRASALVSAHHTILTGTLGPLIERHPQMGQVFLVVSFPSTVCNTLMQGSKGLSSITAALLRGSASATAPVVIAAARKSASDT